MRIRSIKYKSSTHHLIDDKPPQSHDTYSRVHIMNSDVSDSHPTININGRNPQRQLFTEFHLNHKPEETNQQDLLYENQSELKVNDVFNRLAIKSQQNCQQSQQYPSAGKNPCCKRKQNFNISAQRQRTDKTSHFVPASKENPQTGSKYVSAHSLKQISQNKSLIKSTWHPNFLKRLNHPWRQPDIQFLVHRNLTVANHLTDPQIAQQNIKNPERPEFIRGKN